jgi:hypothetical protein
MEKRTIEGMACEQTPVRFIENFIIIWVDSNLHHKNITDDDIQTSIAALRQIVNSIIFVDTNDACIDFIDKKIKQEKIFLIISGSLGQHLIPQIKHNINLDSIYIFCMKKIKHEQWATKNQHHKIKGIFTDIQDVCNQLKEDIKQCKHEFSSIQILGLQTSKVCNHLDASFMYSQLLKEIPLALIQDDADKDELVNYCRQQCSNNDRELRIIDEFEEKYDLPSPIWWYTRECFTYSMLNKALRTQDIEVIVKMGFFVRGLHS